MGTTTDNTLSNLTTGDHTPGPWRVGPMHKDGSFAIHADKASVVHCTPFLSSHAEAEANARLIAAAPDMLRALRAVEFVGPRFKCGECGGQPSTGHTTGCRVAAAIAKAEGH